MRIKRQSGMESQESGKCSGSGKAVKVSEVRVDPGILSVEVLVRGERRVISVKGEDTPDTREKLMDKIRRVVEG